MPPASVDIKRSCRTQAVWFLLYFQRMCCMWQTFSGLQRQRGLDNRLEYTFYKPINHRITYRTNNVRIILTWLKRWAFYSETSPTSAYSHPITSSVGVEQGSINFSKKRRYVQWKLHPAKFGPERRKHMQLYFEPKPGSMDFKKNIETASARGGGLWQWKMLLNSVREDNRFSRWYDRKVLVLAACHWRKYWLVLVIAYSRRTRGSNGRKVLVVGKWQKRILPQMADEGSSALHYHHNCSHHRYYHFIIECEGKLLFNNTFYKCFTPLWPQAFIVSPQLKSQEGKSSACRGEKARGEGSGGVMSKRLGKFR